MNESTLASERQEGENDERGDAEQAPSIAGKLSKYAHYDKLQG